MLLSTSPCSPHSKIADFFTFQPVSAALYPFRLANYCLKLKFSHKTIPAPFFSLIHRFLSSNDFLPENVAVFAQFLHTPQSLFIQFPSRQKMVNLPLSNLFRQSCPRFDQPETKFCQKNPLQLSLKFPYTVFFPPITFHSKIFTFSISQFAPTVSHSLEPMRTC